VRLIEPGRNLGAPGRTLGVRAAARPVVALADDNSWWEPGALARAANLFAAHERLALLCGRIIVEHEGVIDPACSKMAHGPRDPDLPGPSLLGHLGCGAIVRREAYLQSGGYSSLLHFGGEERLLSVDLAVGGWQQ
jgi:hypothetical protein